MCHIGNWEPFWYQSQFKTTQNTSWVRAKQALDCEQAQLTNDQSFHALQSLIKEDFARKYPKRSIECAPMSGKKYPMTFMTSPASAVCWSFVSILLKS